MARNISFKQAISEALDLEMRRDPNVIILGEDIVGGAGSPQQGSRIPRGPWRQRGGQPEPAASRL